MWVQLRDHVVRVGWLTGRTTRDSDIIRQCLGTAYFAEGDVDKLLDRLSELGYGLEYPPRWPRLHQ